jgi:hypothetical protein
MEALTKCIPLGPALAVQVVDEKDQRATHGRMTP